MYVNSIDCFVRILMIVMKGGIESSVKIGII